MSRTANATGWRGPTTGMATMFEKRARESSASWSEAMVRRMCPRDTASMSGSAWSVAATSTSSIVSPSESDSSTIRST